MSLMSLQVSMLINLSFLFMFCPAPLFYYTIDHNFFIPSYFYVVHIGTSSYFQNVFFFSPFTNMLSVKASFHDSVSKRAG